jgi:hypothetical protein
LAAAFGAASAFGAGAAGAAAVVAAAGVASAPHWALRKSFHFWPANVPASLAVLYFALHSAMVRADAGAVSIAAALTSTAMQQTCIRIFMINLLLNCIRPIPEGDRPT